MAVQGHEQVGGATKRGAPDTSVVIPAAVKAAADRANELSRQAQEARDNAPPEHNKPLSETLRAPEVSKPNGVVTQNFDPSNPNPPKDVPGAAPAPQAPQQAQQPAPQQAPQQQTPEELEHSFRSMKGRYDRAEEDKRNMARQLQETQRLLAQLSVAPAQSSAAPEGSGVRFGAPPPPPGRYVTSKERTEYGDELLDVVARRAQETYEPFLAQLTGELTQLKRQVGATQNTVAYDAQVKMYDDLAREVPNWDYINKHPAFLRWLDQPDPYSGQIRSSLLSIAHNSNLTGRVIAIFKGFIADEASHNPANYGGQPSGNGASPPPPVDLAQFAAPGRAKPGQTQVPPEKPIFNASDIPQFYRDKTAGKYAGREAEMNAIEAALFEAGRENRIRR